MFRNYLVNINNRIGNVFGTNENDKKVFVYVYNISNIIFLK